MCVERKVYKSFDLSFYLRVKYQDMFFDVEFFVKVIKYPNLNVFCG